MDPPIDRDQRFPARRERLLKLLAELWELWPHFRLGQLLVVFGDDEGDLSAVEDDVIEQRLRRAMDLAQRRHQET
jgi:hypothetical protein